MNDFVLALEKLRGQTCFKSRTKDVKQDLLPKGPGKSNTGSDERPCSFWYGAFCRVSILFLPSQILCRARSCFVGQMLWGSLHNSVLHIRIYNLHNWILSILTDDQNYILAASIFNVFLPSIVITASHLGILFKIRQASRMFSSKSAGKQSSKAEIQFIRVILLIMPRD